MENASKALIMAASVLLGLMIISVGVALIRSFRGSSTQIIDDIERSRVAAFNSQFTQYYGMDSTSSTKGITAHDIVSLINMAKSNNTEYEVDTQTTNNDNSFYIRVYVKNLSSSAEKCTEAQLVTFMKNNYDSHGNPILYYVKNLNISKITGRVNYVEIQR